jgi:4-amino-4-deoxy-L-arabinose transferase-like glycosyltransferase
MVDGRPVRGATPVRILRADDRRDASSTGGALTIAALLAVLLLSLPGFCFRLEQGVPHSWHEGATLATAQETWLRQHRGIDDAWVVPYVNGAPRVVKPPLAVWSAMLTWTGLSPDDVELQTLITRARLGGVVMGLLTVAGLFWIGTTLIDIRLGALAGLFAATLPYFQEYARIPAYDNYMLGWCTLAVAAGMWSMRPFSSAPGLARRLIGWGMAAVFLWLGWMSKGPQSIVWFAAGTAPVIALDRRRRWVNLVAMVVAIVLAAAMYWPWHAALGREVENPSASLLGEYSGPKWDYRPFWWYVPRLYLLLPWLIWVIAGLVHPWARASGDARRVRLIAWMWFLIVLVAVSVFPAKVHRYLLPIVPSAALLGAQVWRDHIALARDGRPDRTASRLYVPHWIVVLVVSIGVMLLFATPEWAVERGWVEPYVRNALGPAASLALGVVLLGLGAAGWRWHARMRPDLAAAAAIVWAVILTTLMWDISARPRDDFELVTAEANRVVAIVKDRPFIHLRDDIADRPGFWFLFATRRAIPRVDASSLRARLNGVDGSVFVMTVRDDHAALLGELGFERLLRFEDRPGRARTLWGIGGSGSAGIPDPDVQ